MSKESICSSALALLGESPIDSMESDSDVARICSQLYNTRKWALLSEYPWSFSKKKAQLQRLVAAPASRWRYQFQLPTDRVGDVFALFPTEDVGYTRSITDFEVQGSKVLHNHTELWIDYQYNVNEGDLPPHFVQLFVYALAADFAMPISHESTMASYWREVAFGTPSENNRGGYFRVATGIDSRGHPPPVFDSDELIDIRNG